jgi:hypothetical protein
MKKCLLYYVFSSYLKHYIWCIFDAIQDRYFLYTVLSVTGPFNNKRIRDFMQYVILNAICVASMDLHLQLKNVYANALCT